MGGVAMEYRYSHLSQEYLHALLAKKLAVTTVRSAANWHATASRPSNTRAAMNRCGPTAWPCGAGAGIVASSWRASRTCKLTSDNVLRWIIRPSRLQADWRKKAVACASVMSRSIASSNTVWPRRITAGTSCCRAVNSIVGGVPRRADLPQKPLKTTLQLNNARQTLPAANSLATGRRT